MRVVAKNLRARASEHLSNFCEQFEQRPNFASTFKLNGTIRYPLFLIGFLFAARRTRSGRMIKTSDKAVLWVELSNIISYVSSSKKMPFLS